LTVAFEPLGLDAECKNGHDTLGDPEKGQQYCVWPPKRDVHVGIDFFEIEGISRYEFAPIEDL
jgi:hypothetical protein